MIFAHRSIGIMAGAHALLGTAGIWAAVQLDLLNEYSGPPLFMLAPSQRALLGLWAGFCGKGRPWRAVLATLFFVDHYSETSSLQHDRIFTHPVNLRGRTANGQVSLRGADYCGTRFALFYFRVKSFRAGEVCAPKRHTVRANSHVDVLGQSGWEVAMVAATKESMKGIAKPFSRPVFDVDSKLWIAVCYNWWPHPYKTDERAKRITQIFLAQVERILYEICGWVSGYGLLTEIDRSPRPVVIIPRLLGSTAGKKDYQLKDFFNSTAQMKRSGLSYGVLVRYLPQAWTSGLRTRFYLTSDAVLVHELSHAVWMRHGPVANPPVQGFKDLSEFVAVLITNIYRSEKSETRLRASYEGPGTSTPMTTRAQEQFATRYASQIDVLIKRHPEFVQKLGRVRAKFNPVRELLGV